MKKIKLYLELLFSKYTNITFENDKFVDVTIDIVNEKVKVHYGSNIYTLNKNGEIYNNLYDKFIPAFAVINSGGFWGIIKNHKIHIYDKCTGKKILFPKFKYVFFQKRDNNELIEILHISNQNKLLLTQIEKELKELKQDRSLYVNHNMTDDYTKTYDILIANKALVESREEVLNVAVDKVNKLKEKSKTIENFINSLDKREKRIKEISESNIKMHTTTASCLMLINDNKRDISYISRICNEKLNITDSYELTQIKEKLRLNEKDFKKIYEEL